MGEKNPGIFSGDIFKALTGGLSSTYAPGTAAEPSGNALSPALPAPSFLLSHTRRGRPFWCILARIAPLSGGTPFDDIAHRLLPLGDPDAARQTDPGGSLSPRAASAPGPASPRRTH